MVKVAAMSNMEEENWRTTKAFRNWIFEIPRFQEPFPSFNCPFKAFIGLKEESTKAGYNPERTAPKRITPKNREKNQG